MTKKDNKEYRLKKLRSQSENWRKEKADVYKTYIKTSAVGLEVGLSLLIGVGAGYAIDQWLDSEPIGILIGMVVGGVAAAKALISFSKKYIKENESESENGNKHNDDRESKGK